MKSSRHIISLLKRQSEFLQLGIFAEINLFKSAFLTPHLNKQLSFIYFKNQTLFFVAKHPAFCQEFDYTRKGIIQTLRIHPDKFPNLSTLKDAKTFLSRNTQFSRPQETMLLHHQKIQTFKERSEGEFTNYCTDPELYEIFEHIRTNIKKLS